MEIATVKAEAIAWAGIQHTHAGRRADMAMDMATGTETETTLSNMTFKSLPHREQIGGSTVHPGDIEIIDYCLRALFFK